MSGNNVAVHSQEQTISFLDALQVSGWGEGDDTQMVEDNADSITPQVGAGGDVILNVSSDRSKIVTLKLQPTSTAHTFLRAHHRRLKQGIPETFAFTTTNLINGITGGAEQCIVMSAPPETGGQNSTDREWKIFAGCYIEGDVSFGVGSVTF